MKTYLEQTQKQVLSHQMIQSVEILQMSSQDLTDYIKEVALENPVVEIEETRFDDKEQERLKKLEWLSNLDEQNHLYYKYDREDTEQSNPIYNVTSRNSEALADTLKMQLIGKGYTDTEMEIFNYIAHCLDDKGYFTLPVSEIAKHFSISEEKAEECLAVMRELEPVGICADSLKSCLIKQLECMEGDFSIEKELILSHMELLGKNQLPVIAKRMKISLERVKKAQECIRSLNPKPAQGYDNGELSKYATPDITIVKLENHFEILLNNYTQPVIHINKEYINMMKTSKDSEVKEYLEHKIQQIEQIKNHIYRRNSTLLELARCIVDAQREFFLYGESEIRPLLLKDAAGIMGVHESTVSRAVKDKYLQCCWGVYPLSYFFSRALSQEDAVSVAATKVKQEMAHLIEYEDKAHPYSDQKLVNLLNEKGVEISRRTVTKYREAMGIPNGRMRKEF